MGWNFLSIPKLQRLHRWSLGNKRNFTPQFIMDYLWLLDDYLSILWLKLCHVSKSGHRQRFLVVLSLLKTLCEYSTYVLYLSKRIYNIEYEYNETWWLIPLFSDLILNNDRQFIHPIWKNDNVINFDRYISFRLSNACLMEVKVNQNNGANGLCEWHIREEIHTTVLRYSTRNALVYHSKYVF